MEILVDVCGQHEVYLEAFSVGSCDNHGMIVTSPSPPPRPSPPSPTTSPAVKLPTVELALAISIFIAIHSLRQRRRHGLATWPLLGMLPSLVLGLRRNIYELITSVLVDRGGTFTFRGPWLTNLHCVITADPRNLEHLLKSKFLSFPKGAYFAEAVRDLLGGGIFAADDETWRRQRKTASLAFHSSEFRAMTARSLVELVHHRLLPVIEFAVTGDAVVDLQDVLLRLTFDNVCMIAFGIDPGCLRQGLPDIQFATAFEEATEGTVQRFVMPTTVWKAMRTLDIGSERRLRRSIMTVDAFAYDVIRKRREEMKSTVAGRSDLLTAFMKEKDEEGGRHSDEFLRDVCVNFILAGRDTSSVALTWLFWLLERNGRVEEKIVEEVKGIVKERGEEEKVSGGWSEVVFRPEEVKKMEYLQAAISEALRLYPSVPIDHKEVIKDEIFPDGTALKKGTKVIYSIYSMGRMESIWGKDCREYKPERWLRDDGRFMSESAYKFVAFNGGPRLCLGKDFAYYQMKFVAASLLLHYHVTVVKGHPVLPKLALTMYMKHGLKVKLTRRHD
ncbi:cytochrome P450 86B1-like [Phalaenopsis equestris]|uniref:cytochrome P450 86B1-like n=1 Tax=Phalaenopsis equestris TaxID=78828 RepID=UPI0009E23359|nr:cytochrome P450 86B1-like [Phalaenopsis equestris]